jgi:thioester reductase-like protein
MENKAIFLTGVTGALGPDMIKEILAAGNETIFLLIRRKKTLSHWARAQELLSKVGYEDLLGSRVHVFEGDVTHPRLGLKDAEIDMLRSKVTDFYHIAALTSLNAEEKVCNRVNVYGTENALQLASDFHANGNLHRFHYFSTAYAVGSLRALHSYEDHLPENPAFANFYESSKFMAEKKVREAMCAGLPVTIFRPSIVVGHSRTGEVSEFNVIYPFLRLFTTGIIKILPCHPESSFNIVPIDFISKASVTISRQEDALGKSYHLVSKNPPTIGMMLNLKNEVYPGIADITLVDPAEYTPRRLDILGKLAYNKISPYLGYLNEQLIFDTENTSQALGRARIQFPYTGYEFLKTMVGYAVEQGYLTVR